MEVILFFFFVFILILVFLIATSSNNQSTIKYTISHLSREYDKLKADYDKLVLLGYEDSNKLYYVGFKNEKKEIILNIKENPNYVIKYGELLGVELIEDNTSVMSAGNIIKGAVIAGDTGAIIGAMNKKEKVTKRIIRFSLNNFNTPTFELNLLYYGGSNQYGVDIYDATNKIMGTFKYIIENRNVFI